MAKAVESVPASVQPAAKKVSAPSVAPVAVKTQKFSAPPSARPVRAAGWTTRLNPFRTSEPVAPSPASAVQVELSLDAVKVVHNDLADADIEIVPVKSRTVAVMEAPVLPPARQAWEFMGERLMSAD